MTRETRIGLVVGLLFIVMFALVLSELTGGEGPPVPACGQDLSADDSPWIEQVGRPHLPGVSRRPGTPAPAADPRGGPGMTPLTAHRPQVAPAPPAPAAPAPRPVPRAPRVAPARQHLVRQGDRLIDIAKKYYGANNGHLYKHIFEANRSLLDEEGTLQPGQILVIPRLVERAAPAGRTRPGAYLAPAAPAGRRPVDAALRPVARPQTYRVRRGDNLTDIARRFLHDGSRAAVQRILNANRGRISNPHILPVGVELVIPS